MTPHAETRHEPFAAAYCAWFGMELDGAPTGRGANVRYLKWMRERWDEYFALHPEHFTPESKIGDVRATPEGFAAFEVWLTEEASVRSARYSTR
jgi:hypothetical protein